MSRWSHLFFGRENELGALRTAWQRAKAGSPQIVPIIAETGYGKTRLAQEFFNWLSSVEDGVGGDGYWPDCLLRVADNLQPNPSVDACAVDGRSIPFLWWGLRLSDPGERNEIATTALRTGEEYLKAHLAAYSRTLAINEKRRQQAISGSLNVTDIAMNIAGGLPVIGTVRHPRNRQDVGSGRARSLSPGNGNRRAQGEWCGAWCCRRLEPNRSGRHDRLGSALRSSCAADRHDRSAHRHIAGRPSLGAER